METGPPSSENPDQVIWSADDQGPSQSRSYYECTFCKKGFSNAQALGGHMNIHRKDRAKIKYPSNDYQLTLDTNKRFPNPLHLPNSADHLTFESEDEHRSNTIKWPWALPSEDVATAGRANKGELKQLSLFVDSPTPTSGDDQQSMEHGRDGDGKSRSPSHDPVGVELDLELRLGHEPQDMSLAGHKKSP